MSLAQTRSPTATAAMMSTSPKPKTRERKIPQRMETRLTRVEKRANLRRRRSASLKARGSNPMKRQARRRIRLAVAETTKRARRVRTVAFQRRLRGRTGRMSLRARRRRTMLRSNVITARDISD